MLSIITFSYLNMFADLNWWALLLSVVASAALGTLWYSDFLFGKKWRDLMGWSGENLSAMKSASMTKVYAINLILDLLTAFAIWNIATPLCLTWSCANVFALVAWIGFMLPILGGSVLWERKSWTLLAINAGYRLVALLAMVGIIAQFAF